ncbi:MAG: signal transduction histidine kinase/DNA-binding NarL/FixJ family response regulator [Myxococcota bacterium]
MSASYRVLLIDDAADERELAELVLRRDGGLRVLHIGNAMQFAMALAHAEFDAVIMECELSWTSPEQVISTLRQNGEQPIILFTRPGHDHVLSESIGLGLDAYILKSPSGFLELPQRVVAAIERPRIRTQAPAVVVADEWMAELVEEAGLGAFRAHADGRLMRANDTFSAILDLGSPKSLIGKDVFTLCLPEDARSELVSRLLEDGAIHSEQLAIRSGSHDAVYIALTITSGEDSVLGPVLNGLIEDITHRKRLESKLERALEQPAPPVAQAPVSPPISPPISDAMMAAHDLKEPLRTMARYSQLLLEKYDGQLDADADEYLGFVRDAAGRMQERVDSLLSTGSTQLSDITEIYEVTDVEVILSQVLAQLGATIESSGAQITMDKLPKVLVPHEELAHLLQNLIENAIKFRDQDIPRIHVSSSRRGDLWQFSVTDNGIGVPPEAEQTIFGMFARAHEPEEYAGTGIGLAVCKGVVERYGGEIWVEAASVRGTRVAGRRVRTIPGSSFCFTLPGEEGGHLRAVTNPTGPGIPGNRIQRPSQILGSQARPRPDLKLTVQEAAAEAAMAVHAAVAEQNAVAMAEQSESGSKDGTTI